MRRATLSLAALSTAVAPLPLLAEVLPGEVAAQPETVRLTPAGKWNIDFADNKCSLQRAFEINGERHVLNIEQDAPSDSFRIIGAGPELVGLKNVSQPSVGLRSDLPLVAGVGLSVTTVPGYGEAATISTMSLWQLKFVRTRQGIAIQTPEKKPTADGEYLTYGEVDQAQAAKVERIVLADARGKTAVSFETGNMKAAFAALNSCTADLLREWGLDPAQHKAFVAPHMVNRESFTRQIQKSSDESGTFVVRLIVEADGKISNCHIEAMTKVEEIELACGRITRIAKMAPGLDAEGKPIRSFFTQRITYQLF